MTRWQRIKGVIFKRRYELLGAIDLLVEVHTLEGYSALDDHDWSIKMGATPPQWLPTGSYVRAWRTLRKAVGRRAD